MELLKTVMLSQQFLVLFFASMIQRKQVDRLCFLIARLQIIT